MPSSERGLLKLADARGPSLHRHEILSTYKNTAQVVAEKWMLNAQ
ncbi:hypothetical protein [Glaciimonas sp. PCH181]|nr:hypothetical protein [Glaciimonas sp. PCH181]